MREREMEIRANLSDRESEFSAIGMRSSNERLQRRYVHRSCYEPCLSIDNKFRQMRCVIRRFSWGACLRRS